MKRLTYIIVVALVAMTLLAPAALAQEETTIIEETTVYPEGAPAAGDAGTGTTAGGADGPLPPSGGPAILAPAVALLLGSGVVALAVLRRGR